MKKILFLGGSTFQLPPIIYSLNKGYYVITLDKNKNCPGFICSNESYEISIDNKNEVLKLAKKLKIDAVVAFASDKAALTASYISEKLKLPGNPLKAVKLLTHKDLYKRFLQKNNFFVPNFKTYSSKIKAYKFAKKMKLPIFIKPIDSSGSKGVTKLKNFKNFNTAFNNALKFSQKKRIIIEESITRKHYQIAGDAFVMKGKLVFACLADEHFNEGLDGLITIGPSFPTTHKKDILKKIYNQVQKIIKLIGLKMGALNFDIIIDKNNNPYLFEIGPRNGGGLVPTLIKNSTGVDLIKYTVEIALGTKLKLLKFKNSKSYWSSFIVHSEKKGIFKKLFLNKSLKKNIIEKNLFINPGEKVEKYNDSRHALGYLLLKFNKLSSMLNLYKTPNKYVRVVVK